jgi:hypothetical protein
MRGGNWNGAAEYARQVYGDATSQHAGVGNVIAMNKVTGGKLSELTPADYKGGKNRRNRSRKNHSRRYRRTMRR